MNINDDSGQGTAEYAVVGLLMLVALVFGILTLWRHPEYVDKGIVVAVFAAGLAALGWSLKMTLGALLNRAELLILEELSRKKRASSGEIKRYLVSKNPIYAVLPSMHTDALAVLVHGHRVHMVDGIYHLSVDRREAR